MPGGFQEERRDRRLTSLPAYYVEGHPRQAWEPLLFEDEELVVDRKRRDPGRRPSLEFGATQEEDALDTGESAGAECPDVAGSSGNTLS